MAHRNTGFMESVSYYTEHKTLNSLPNGQGQYFVQTQSNAIIVKFVIDNKPQWCRSMSPKDGQKFINDLNTKQEIVIQK